MEIYIQISSTLFIGLPANASYARFIKIHIFLPLFQANNKSVNYIFEKVSKGKVENIMRRLLDS